MFRDLYAIARHTPLNLIITPRGEQLGIIVMPKPSGDAADNPALSKPLSIVGTPEELDTEFAAALAKYSASVNELRTSLDLPLDALEEAKRKAAKKEVAKTDKVKLKEEQAKARSEAAKKGAATRTAKAEEKRKAKEKAARERAQARATKKAARKQSFLPRKITLPGATAPKPAAAAQPEAATRHLASKPGKAECIADYVALQAKVKEPLTRRGFIKRAQTGRRYEKLWKNWEEFIAEVKGGALASAYEALAEDLKGVEYSPAAGAAKPGKEVVVVPPLKTIDDWPFPAGKSTKEQANSWADREQSAEAFPSSSPTAAKLTAQEPQPKAEPATKPSEALYEVCDEAGEVLFAYRSQPEIDERLEIPGRDGRFRVTEIDGFTVTARHVMAVRLPLFDSQQNRLGATDELYEVGDRVLELEGDFRVTSVSAAWYLVRDTAAPKPRVKGPAATAAPATEGAPTA